MSGPSQQTFTQLYFHELPQCLFKQSILETLCGYGRARARHHNVRRGPIPLFMSITFANPTHFIDLESQKQRSVEHMTRRLPYVDELGQSLNYENLGYTASRGQCKLHGDESSYSVLCLYEHQTMSVWDW